jgi:hypothetical protein
MSALPPPFRFLLLVVGAWIGIRAVALSLPWGATYEGAPLPFAKVSPSPAPSATMRPLSQAAQQAGRFPYRTSAPSKRDFNRPDVGGIVALLPATPRPALPIVTAGVASLIEPDEIVAGLGGWQPQPTPSGRRWSASAWLFVRDTKEVALAPGGALGGGQAGGRLLYRLREHGRLALSARGYVPLSNPDAGEVGVGVDWQPSERVPVRLLVERRQAVGDDGRSAFALTAYGGVSDVTVGPARLDAYGQAGVVGARSPDPFADGALRVSLPAGRTKFGIGAWGAAQPGAERVDVGPQASVSIPAGRAAVTIAADWRVRIAGDAAPAGGPTLTIATEF